jgi:hypothetical protein
MLAFMLVVLGAVMWMPFLVSAVEAMVMAIGAAVMCLATMLAGFGRLLAFRIRVGCRTAASVTFAAALAVEARLGCMAADMADGVLLLGQREDMRIAAGLRGAALGVVLLMFFMMSLVPCT